jgi:hypothetical protein
LVWLGYKNVFLISNIYLHLYFYGRGERSSAECDERASRDGKGREEKGRAAMRRIRMNKDLLLLFFFFPFFHFHFIFFCEVSNK